MEHHSRSDYASLKSMVMAFRVTELQMLLQWANKNKSGKKSELQQRAVELVKRHTSSSLVAKVRELHRQRYHHQPDPVESKPSRNAYGSSYQSSACSTASPAHGSKYDYQNESYASMPCLSHFSQPSAMGAGAVATTRGPPPRADVQYQSLPFFDVLDVLVKPSSLLPGAAGGHSRFQESTLSFQLSTAQANKVAMSKVVAAPAHTRSQTATAEFGIQIQLRFCLLETTSAQADHFPPNCCVKVNGKMCALPQPMPSQKPGVEAKRPSKPVNITHLCKHSPVAPNSIQISWAGSAGNLVGGNTTAYAVTVHLVRKLSASDLQGRIKAKGARDADHTRAMVKEKLRHDVDSEIATMSLKGSLLCPLGKMRLQFPCRAITCQHIQCFDGLLYLQMNEKRPAWTCPVCDKTAAFPDLFLDGLFLDILSRAPSKCDQVEFGADGEWKPLGDVAQAAVRKVVKAEDNQDIETIDEDDSDESDEQPRKKARNGDCDNGGKKKSSEPEMICLSSDDEDEGEGEGEDTSDCSDHAMAAVAQMDLQQLLELDSSSLDQAFGTTTSINHQPWDTFGSPMVDLNPVSSNPFSFTASSSSFRPSASSLSAAISQSQRDGQHPSSHRHSLFGSSYDIISIDDD